MTASAASALCALRQQGAEARLNKGNPALPFYMLYKDTFTDITYPIKKNSPSTHLLTDHQTVVKGWGLQPIAECRHTGTV